MRIVLPVFLLFFSFVFFGQQKHEEKIRSIYGHFLTGSDCYSNLEYLTTKIGARVSGSSQAAKAVEWARRAMYAAGADTVILQPCMVAQWVRGAPEQCHVTRGGKKQNLRCTALGSSVGTSPKGIHAQVVEVSSFEALDSLGEKNIKGKVVFYNVFFDQRHISTFDAYVGAVKFRGRGASYAAKYGAVACIVRSMTTLADDEPHTGNMHYDTTLSKNKIPAFALGYKSADLLHDALKKDKNSTVFMRAGCRTLEPVLSYNVVGQINGSEKPGTYIIAGGHLDSWDLGQGAHDDGAGIVQSIAVLQAFKKLGLAPRHSIRAVAFMNEENGLAGGKAYAKAANDNNEMHLAAIETDAGGYSPRGFSADTTAGLFEKVISWKPLFERYFVDHFEKKGGGADLRDLQVSGVPCLGFIPDQQRYFDVHHSASDTFDKVNKRELELGGAAICSLIYLLDLEFGEE